MRDDLDLDTPLPHLRRPVEDLSTKELLSELVEQARCLAREQTDVLKGDVAQGRSRLVDDVAIARREIREEMGQAKRAGTSLGVGVVLCHAALYFLLGALALGLWAAGLPLWAGVFLVGIVACIAGGILLKGGTTRLKGVKLAPKRTIERLKEEKRWMRERFHALRARIRASA